MKFSEIARLIDCHTFPFLTGSIEFIPDSCSSVFSIDSKTMNFIDNSQFYCSQKESGKVFPG